MLFYGHSAKQKKTKKSGFSSVFVREFYQIPLFSLHLHFTPHFLLFILYSSTNHLIHTHTFQFMNKKKSNTQLTLYYSPLPLKSINSIPFIVTNFLRNFCHFAHCYSLSNIKLPEKRCSATH